MKLRLIVAVSVILFGLSSCGANPRLVDHSFSFNAVWDSPNIEVLNYRYGDSKQPGARPPEWALQGGKVAQRTGISGPMLLGEDLYVKWKIKSTGEVFEDTVDLRKRLPDDIAQHHVYFIVKESQLYVYLISPERRPVELPPNGPRAYQHLKAVSIYPDRVK
jgi:hypothetical protein